MSMRELVVFGAGGHAAMILEAARAAGGWSGYRVCDDDLAKHGGMLLDQGIAGGRDWLLAQRDRAAVVPAIGGNRLRMALIAWLEQEGFAIASVVHPGAIVSPSASMGAGVFVAPGAVVGARTLLESGVIVNTSASVDHDCTIGAAAHVGPGAHLCGGVRVGELSMIGVGSCARPGAVIGSNCVVGAGAAVVSDVPDGATVVGVPARPIQTAPPAS